MPALPLPAYCCQEKVHDYQEAALDGNVANYILYIAAIANLMMNFAGCTIRNINFYICTLLYIEPCCCVGAYLEMW